MSSKEDLVSKFWLEGHPARSCGEKKRIRIQILSFLSPSGASGLQNCIKHFFHDAAKMLNFDIFTNFSKSIQNGPKRFPQWVRQCLAVPVPQIMVQIQQLRDETLPLKRDF